MSAYQPFLISEFKTGIHTYLEPWIRPADAFEPLVNAYIYRGTVNKRAGYTSFGAAVADGKPIMGIMQYIDQTTGAISLLIATTVHLYIYDGGTNTYLNIVLPADFTGNIENFFKYTNWQEAPGASSVIYMCNNKDPVTLYDGTSATQPTIYIDSAHTQNITTCLDLKVYKQRLLYIRPTLSVDGEQNQSIYWSAISNATNVVTDIAGNGGFLAAPTGDIIQCAEFIRDVLVVFFTNSVWTFRYTGNDTAPFRWDKISNVRTTTCPYASVPYDERCTSIGNTGLIACDAVNAQRYDIPIIDYYETTFSQAYFAQAFSQRYDNLNQAWTLYVSQSNIFPLVSGIAPGSDSALIYNFLENTWATYTFGDPMTCMGLFYDPSGTRWEDLEQSWENTKLTWQSFSSQKTAPMLLMGDTTGNVHWVDNELAVADGQLQVAAEVIATGNGSASYSGTVASPPVLIGSFSATDSTETFTSNLNGDLTGNLGGTGFINYTTGVWQITFASPVPALTPITANYISYDFEIIPDIVTTRWNPVVSLGQRVQFGYIDIYYYIASTDTNVPVGVTLNFYVDNSQNYSLQKTLTLDGPTNSSYAFKRVYINLIGEFIQMEIDPSINSYMQFLGFILWVRPAGRLTSP